MNDESNPPPEPEGFRSERVRSLTEIHRATDNRMVAGVCAGAARYLNVDPVVLRLLLVILTFAGFAGPILYLAAWFLLPVEGTDRSIAAEWFNLDENEPRVRTAGLVIAAVIAVASIIGDSTWDTEWLIWPALLIAFFYWLFAVRPRRKRAEWEAAFAESGVKPADMLLEEYKSQKVAEALAKYEARGPRSWALTGLTLSAVMIGVAVTWLVDLSGAAIDGPVYAVVALGIVAVGCLVGTLYGHAGPLIGIGFVLAFVMAATSLIPGGGIGDERHRPSVASDVASHYEQGVGRFELNLTDVSNPQALVGRTVEVEMGIGEMVVFVPLELPIRIDAELDTGQLEVFGQEVHGRDNSLDVADDDPEVLTLKLNQCLGNLKVVRE